MKQAGPYLLFEELGRGSNGVVYHARSPEGSSLALKLLSAPSHEALQRFGREARLHERLGEEAGFVPFLDMGSSEEGKPYLVMPLLTGGTLRDLLRRGPLGLAESLELAERLANALSHAHAQGIVHRDVKPENLLFDREGRAFLADLGLAKHFRHDVTGASQSVALSRAGEARGTVSYMAPEQLSDASSAGPPADVFAWGALVYECLAGVPAFSAPTQIELLVQIADARHVPLHQRCACPSWLSALVEECLSASPDRRPPDGQALANELALGPDRARTTRRWPLVSALVAALVALTALGLWKAARLDPAQARATPAPSHGPQPDPSAAPASRPAALPGSALERFPSAWQPFLRTPHLKLTSAWKPPGVSRAAALTLSDEGPIVAGDRRAFLLREGSPLAFTFPLPAKPGTYVFTLNDLLLSLEGKRLRVLELWGGGLRTKVDLGLPCQQVTPALGGRAAVVAQGRRLSLFQTQAQRGRGLLKQQFATLEEAPSALAGGPQGVVAGHGQRVTFFSLQGRAQGTHDLGAPVLALATRRGAAPGTLVYEASGKLHCHDAQRVVRGVVETGLGAKLRALCAGARLAALAGEHELVLVDLDTRRVLERVDLRGLGAALCSLALSSGEDALLVGAEDGHVLRFALADADEPVAPRVHHVAAWGDARARHAEPVCFVSSAGGLWLSGDTGGALHVWNASGEREHAARLPGQRGPAVFVPGAGDRVWSLEQERVRECDLRTGREAQRLPTTDTVPVHAALRRDGAELAVVGFAGHVEVWNLAKGARRFSRSLEDKHDLPIRVVLLPRGRLLLGYNSGTLKLFSRQGAVLWKRRAGDKPVVALQHLEGKRALVACGDGSVTTWALKEGEELQRFKTEALTSLSLAGDRVLLGLRDGRIELRSANTGASLWVLPGEVGVKPRVALGASREALIGGTAGVLRRLAISDEARAVRDLWPRARPGGVLALGFRAGDPPRLTTVEPGSVRTWDPATGAEISRVGFGQASEARWGLGGFAAVGGRLGAPTPTLDLWQFAPKEGGARDVADRLTATQLLKTLPGQFVMGAKGHRGRTFSLSADARVLAFPTLFQRKRGLGVLSLDSKQRPFLPLRHPLLSATGEFFAERRGSGIEIWSTSRVLWSVQGILPITFLGRTEPRLLVSVGRGTYQAVDPRTGQAGPAFTPRARAEPLALAPSPDGARLALHLAMGEVELWDVSKGERVARLLLEEPTDLVKEIAFSADGLRLAVSTTRGRIASYELPPE